MKAGERTLKNTELRLISELMTNSRRSDRELSRVLKVSQPTVSRTISKLEKEGYLREYTVMPNFVKLGYHLFALTFSSWKQNVTKEEMENAWKTSLEEAGKPPSNIIVMERGLGMNHDAVIGSFHKDYSSYTKFFQYLKTNPFLDAGKLESFLINLDDEIHYRPLTLSTLASHLLRMEEEKE
jgi:DNA-binding Lrp family transcriptional regulator